MGVRRHFRHAVHSSKGAFMSKPVPEPVVTAAQSAALRQVNRQVNAMESRNSFPVCGSRPLRLGFDISSVCNVSCIFCLAEDGRKLRSDPDAFRSPDMLDRLEPLLPFIDLGIFSSYEALENPRFDEFALKLHKYRTPFQVFTNGKALAPDTAEFCLRHGMSSVWCSLHGARARTVQDIMRGADFDRVMENLMALKLLARRHNPDFALTLVFCAMRRNIGELPDYVEMAGKVGARDIQVNYLLVTSERRGLDEEAMVFHQDLYDYNVLKAKARAMELGIRLNHQPLFSEHCDSGAPGPCYRPWEHLSVSHTGNTSICCGGAASLGNIFESDFFSVWNSKPFRTFRELVNSDNPPAACKACTRGRENPMDVTAHLTWLRKLPAAERQVRIDEFVARLGTGSNRCFPVQAAESVRAACRL
jgi:MoaA/NifB/PqqE/SkfB family radical SAM enzyme